MVQDEQRRSLEADVQISWCHMDLQGSWVPAESKLNAAESRQHIVNVSFLIISLVSIRGQAVVSQACR